MKKFLSLILIFSLLLLTVSCVKNNNNLQTTTDNDLSNSQVVISATQNNTSIEKNDTLTLMNNTTTEFTVDEYKAPAQNDIGGGTLALTKYRSIYCYIPRPFANLVELYEFQNWYEDVIEENPNETNLMVMKLFVQEFNIIREEFDKANLEWAKIIVNGFDGEPMMNPQDFANQETDEVYNADIIYTFDDEIINSYYLSHEYPFVYVTDYENALEAGTYETQTTDWVDVEAMEAEIIAKYGEAEIVTEPETATAEAVTTDFSQTETIE